MTFSSSGVHGVFLMLGSRWFSHLVRHCLPVRLTSGHCRFRCSAMVDQRLVPYCCTSAMMAASSSGRHARRWKRPFLGGLAVPGRAAVGGCSIVGKAAMGNDCIFSGWLAGRQAGSVCTAATDAAVAAVAISQMQHAPLYLAPPRGGIRTRSKCYVCLATGVRKSVCVCGARTAKVYHLQATGDTCSVMWLWMWLEYGGVLQPQTCQFAKAPAASIFSWYFYDAPTGRIST